ncbi:predicted protein [Aspergillus nidulans FGSC A4]|uniref:Uncharacterized protein n=1 Tax=Emericella nidulans (strain FGSC A4 / ATCC 38163 / CBS 112.46 / NRRL 194 / M139) TaxID=227321 RepID=Q5AWY5_EMENI|nr:hypothetical protein [Aspergillus nidulans FGSC A4]EAA61447.1 predicted protein [Aspergillus nidulans FGSC A4]CBF78887.1 TPA: conserved hypothetical protein [Aspergillus nidulans FGSC A4]|eukprot:XP_664799.1 predicted protein [Aspergillus nidulans FGSC A4]
MDTEYNYLNDQTVINDLINLSISSESDSLNENEAEIYHENDDRILHERNQAEVEVKECTHINLLDMNHQEVTDAMFNTIFQKRRDIISQRERPETRTTYSLYRSVCKSFQNSVACLASQTSCKPVLRKHSEPLLTSPFFVSRGIHSHPPPPPNKPPQLILDEILDLIRKMQSPDLTPSLFLRSPALKQFCQKYNGQTLSQIHNSFVNQDRFAAIIAKEKALLYPKGRGLAGVRCELDRHPEYREYVRRIYTDHDIVMIICGFNKQIQLLGSLDSFEVDMSYKRVKGDFNEVIFATFLPQHGKIITLLRVFMDHESAFSYKLLFTRVFQLIADIQGYMCAKQMSGLGHYLQELDPLQRPWTWQLMNILILCRTGDLSDYHSSARCRMESLLTCSTREEYFHLIELLEAHETPKIAEWARHKRHSVIAAGATLSSRILDQRDIDQYLARNQYGTSHLSRITRRVLQDSFLHADLVPVVEVQDLDHGEAVTIQVFFRRSATANLQVQNLELQRQQLELEAQQVRIRKEKAEAEKLELENMLRRRELGLD